MRWPAQAKSPVALTLTGPTGCQRQMRWPARAKSPVALTLTGPTGVPKANALACTDKKARWR
ncbi:TPA: hypothetical protein LR639_000172 [Enterobacter hormaechei]|nr:hypothetical protein [Enterobacter hormaechei]HBL6127322.1 hypothetical protein [Enterobacter hormaechei]